MLAIPHRRRTGNGADWRRVVLWSCRGVLVAWAGFWTWFALAGALSPGHGWSEVWAVALPAVALAAVAWRWPRLGGALLIGAGLVAAWLFGHPAALSLLAAPAVVIGAALLVTWRRPRPAPSGPSGQVEHRERES